VMKSYSYIICTVHLISDEEIDRGCSMHVWITWETYIWVVSSGIYRRVVRWKSTDVSEEHVALLLQGRRIRQATEQREKSGKQSNMFLRKIGSFSTDHVASYPRWQNSSAVGLLRSTAAAEDVTL
jgi:hypothetical protein